MQEAKSVSRFQKFSESNYKAPQYIKDLEEQGRRGDRVLVRSISTGSAKVSVKVADPVYKVSIYSQPIIRRLEQIPVLQSRYLPFD